MSTFVKQQNGRVLFTGDNGDAHGFSTQSFLLPHKTMNDFIIISASNSKQNPVINGINVNWRSITIPKEFTTRNEAIDYLNVYIFNDSSNLLVAGRSPGTLFGDDSRTTSKKSASAGMWVHGLPIFATKYSIVGSGRWYIPNDVGAPAYPDGTSIFETGTDVNGKIFVTSDPNRYEPGSLSYFIFTVGFLGLLNATGNFTLLFGAMSRGLQSDGTFGDIKEGVVIGFRRNNGIFQHIFRIYKNFRVFQEQIIPYDPDQLENLKILRLEVGYLGIHPALVNEVNFETLQDELAHVFRFYLQNTSIANPNLSIGVYAENQGNNTNLQVANGSFNYGNYSDRDAPDASSRGLIDSLEVPSIPSGTDTVIAVYTLPEKLTMIDSLSGSGTTTREFINTIANKLKSAKATGVANKPIYVNIYLVPKTDVVATFTPLRANVNAIERAIPPNITSVSLVNANQIGLLLLSPTDRKDVVNVNDEEILLRPDFVGVITVSCSQSITDLVYVISTEDQF